MYTAQYGWLWMPYAEGYTYAPPDGIGDAQMSVYSDARGAGRERAPESPAAWSLPEADPADRFTPRERLQPNDLDEVVVVKVTGLGRDPPAEVDVLAPDLTPSSAVELRQTFPECLWRPALAPDGGPARAEFTLLVHDPRR